MRLVAGMLAVLLSGSLAHAEGGSGLTASRAAPKVPLRVVRMLPESHQALLFDKLRDTHVLADVGATIEGYVVEDIDDDQVTLSAGATQVVLAAPDQSWRRRRAETTAPASSAPSAGPAKADLSKLAPLPVDPYGEPDVRVADAPRAITAGEGGVRVTSAAAPPAEGSFSSGWTVPTPSPGVATMGTGPQATGTDPPTIHPGPPVRVVTAPPVPDTAPLGGDPAWITPDVSGDPTPDTAPHAALSPVTTAAAQSTTVTDAAVISTTTRTARTPAPTTSSLPTVRPTAQKPTTQKGKHGATSTADAGAFADALADGDASRSTVTTAPAGPPATTDWVPADAADAMTAAMAPDAAAPSPSGASPVFLGRHEVDVALADFGALAAAVHGSFTPSGARLESVAQGSLFARAGLRAGDLITAVDGKPLRSLDDAANLYARASSATAVTVAITRAGKPLTLRMSIQ